MAKTPAQRKKAERARMRAAGYVLRHVWVHPLDWPRVQNFVQRLNKGRAKE